MKRAKNPMPTICFEGQTYTLKSRKVQVPDFQTMSRFEQLMWVMGNTKPKGYSINTNPLAGMKHLLQNTNA